MPERKLISCFDDLLKDINDMIFVVDNENRIVEYINEQVTQTLGYTLQEINEIGLKNIRQNLDNGYSLQEIRTLLETNPKFSDRAKLMKKDGSFIYIDANIRYQIKDGFGFIFVIARDITQYLEDKKELKELNENLSKLVEQKTAQLQKNLSLLEAYKYALDANNLVSMSDLKGNITYVNDNFCRVTGYNKEEILGKPHNILRHKDVPKELFRDMWQTIESKKSWSGVLPNLKKDGSTYWINSSMTPVLDENGNIVEYIAIRHEITELIEQKQKLEQLATTDMLTNLGNRYKLFNDIKSGFKTLVLIDIDNFSHINDFYGYAFGDKLIKIFANILKEEFKDIDINLYRLQADEFAILNVNFVEVDCQAAMLHFLQNIVTKVINIDGEEISIEVSGAVSKDKNSPYTTAIMALKHGKSHKQHLVVYNESISLEKDYANNIYWNKKVQKAIKDDRIVPYYQPIVTNDTLEIKKYETLMRLIDEDGKVISPFYFMEIAKKTKNYKLLTKIMIQKSFEYFKDKDASFSINLDIADIQDNSSVDYITSMLERYNIATKVIFEIVESEEITNYDVVLNFINRVKSYGCKIAIDDFGSGYSNFSYIIKLKADFIKIDGSLIQNIDTDENSLSLVNAIVGFAKDLHMEVVAEFVKNEKIYSIVQSLGIDYSQGYYFSEPKPSI